MRTIGPSPSVGPFSYGADGPVATDSAPAELTPSPGDIYTEADRLRPSQLWWSEVVSCHLSVVGPRSTARLRSAAPSRVREPMNARSCSPNCWNARCVMGMPTRSTSTARGRWLGSGRHSTSPIGWPPCCTRCPARPTSTCDVSPVSSSR